MTMPLVSGFESYSSTARRLARFASAFCHFSQDSDRGFAPWSPKADVNSKSAGKAAETLVAG